MSKSRAWRSIERVAELNELVYALNRFGERAGMNRGEYRSVRGIGSVGEVKEGRAPRAGHVANPDMSPKAVTARLKRVSELRRVCLALGRAEPAKTVSTRRPGNVREGARRGLRKRVSRD